MNDASLYSKDKHGYGSAFTIVELLIVIVVIAILAAIALVSYNGITGQAEEAALKSDLREAATKVALHQAKTDIYPGSLAEAGVTERDDVTVQYVYDENKSYCISVTSNKNAERTFHSTSDGGVDEGSCPETPASCFNFVHASGTITNYYTHQGNNTANPACPRGVVIPKSISGADVVSIGNSAFYEKGITSVILPSTLTSIGASAFYTNSLKSIYLHEGITAIGNLAFARNQISKVQIPNSVASAPLTDVFVSNPVESYTFGTPDYNGSSTIRIGTMSCTASLKSIVLNRAVKEVLYNGFSNGLSGCPNLSSITMQPGIELITGGGFSNSPALKNITITAKVVRQGAFTNTGLETVTFTPEVEQILDGPFQGNPNLVSVSVPTATTVAPSAFPSSVVINRY